ncbi:MAG: hypothetical protein EBT60_05690 [Bacteroidetes bacterium]|nr:hypothetical protein [Bacteroidota bacterium]
MHDAINSSMTTFMGRINNHALGLTVALGAIFLGDVKAQTAVSAPNQTDEFEAVMRHIPKRNIGPGAMSGRVTALAMPRKGALESVNRNVIYAGTASGGVWKSNDGGIGWSPIFDEMDVQSIGSIAVDPLNPSVVYVGTGEGNPRNSHNSGKGLYKSIDAGKTWKCLGLESTKTIHRAQLWVAAMGSVWGGNIDRGVYRSDDGGASWQKVLYVNATTGCAELVIDPMNPQKLYAAMWDFERKPWTFRSGKASTVNGAEKKGPEKGDPSGSGLYISYDGGKTWKRSGVKEGMPKGDIGRIGLAVAASSPNRVYAFIESSETGVYRSDNGGDQWYKVSTEGNAGNRPFYYAELYVDPSNENRVYSIWSQIARSEDGGKHWDILADWGHIHPDHHAFYVHPDDPKYIINGNDGGLNISYDGGQNWRYAENIPVGQFYHVDVDDQEPYNVYGGLQDNGSWFGPAYHWIEGGIKNSEWQEVLFGDGFDVAPIPGKPGEGYAMYQGGNVYHWNRITHQSTYIKPQHPEGKPLRYNWNAAMAVDPFNANGLYYGSQYVHYSSDNGKSWRVISPDLTSNDPKKQEQAKSGGLTVDATGAENHCTILAIAPSAADKNVVYVSTDDGKVHVTRDGGKTWTFVGGMIAKDAPGAWVPYVWTNPKNAAEAWVVVNNYRQNDWAPYLYHTVNYGASWTRKVGADGFGNKEGKGDKVTGYVLSVLPDAEATGLVFLGTDHGLYVSVDGGLIWKKWKGFPSVPVADMKIQARERDLVLGTFGRGIWVFDDIAVLRSWAGKSLTAPAVVTSGVNVDILHAGDGVLARYRQPSGARFAADEAWSAANEWKKLDCVGKVYNESGKLIRTHKFSFDSSGYYRVPYRMVEDGFRWPSHQTPKPDDGIPAGRTVSPGKYKLVISGGKAADSVWIQVRMPQGFAYNALGDAKQREMLDTLKKTIERARLAFEGLKEVEKTVGVWVNQKYLSDSAEAKLKKFERPLLDSVAALKLLYMLPADFRPYEEATIRLMDHLQTAYGLIESNEMPGENCVVALKTAQRETDLVVKRINAFMLKDYSAFVKAVTSQAIAPLIEIRGW